MVIYAMVLFFGCQIWSAKSSFAKKIQHLSFWKIILLVIGLIAAVIFLSRGFPYASFLICTTTIVCSSLLFTRIMTFYEELRLNKF